MGLGLQKKGSFVFFVIGILLLSISYAFNIFNITDNNYKFFDRGDESNIIGRLLMSRTEGVLSGGALTGNYWDYKYKLSEDESVPLITLLPKEEISYDAQSSQGYDDFINDRSIYDGTFAPYKTQSGGQAFIYVIIDNLLPLDGGTKLILFRLITILLSATMLTLFTKWVFNNYGLLVATITFLLIFISPWLFRFAYNLWWALWSYYIPFIFLLFYLDKKRKSKNTQLDLKFYVLLCLAVFVKFFFTGAEFLTSTLIMTICPIIYHLYITSKSLKSSISYLFKSSMACIVGVLIGMMLLVAQLRLLDGTWQAGFEHIVDSFVKRSAYGEASADFKAIDVFLMYFKGEVLYHESFPWLKVSFGSLCFIVTLVSLLVLYLSAKADGETKRRNQALVLTTTISILAPISWVVIFSEHAYTHSHIDYIVWYMPYLLYGFCIIGVFFQLCINYSKNRVELSRRNI